MINFLKKAAAVGIIIVCYSLMFIPGLIITVVFEMLGAIFTGISNGVNDVMCSSVSARIVKAAENVLQGKRIDDRQQ